MTDAALLAPTMPQLRELERLVATRAGLPVLLAQTVRRLERRGSGAEIEGWAEASVRLVNVNAGATLLAATWRAGAELSGRIPVDALAEAGFLLAAIVREAGARSAGDVVAAFPAAAMTGTPDDFLLWLSGLVTLAEAAPGSVGALASSTREVLAGTGAAGFAEFIAAGLRASGRSPARQQAFFRLEDGRARQLIARAGGAVAFSDIERRIAAYATALWGGTPDLRGVKTDGSAPLMRRSNIVGHIVRLPDTYPGTAPADAERTYRSAVAHAGAHLAFGGPRMKVDRFKPLAVALISLIEDARVETLALRAMPGLRRLWLPFHTVAAGGPNTAPLLMARLARALIDPDREDNNFWVAKGRRLFAKAMAERAHDPAISIDIGSILGRDLGQARVPFNGKDYVVEPVYRDNNFGLWDFGDRSAEPPIEISLTVDAARIEWREEAGAGEAEAEPPSSDPAGRARSAPSADLGEILANYPEWDRAAGRERPDWTTVRDVPPVLGDARAFARELDMAAPLRARILRLVRGAKLGRPTRLRRQSDGPELDLDAAIDAAISLRGGAMPDARVFRTTAQLSRDLGVMVLVDTSRSTGDHAGVDGSSILGVERLAVGLLSEALQALGDPFALRAFTSAGRDDVRSIRLKDFDESYGEAVRARLAGLKPALSTRLGAAIRHAGAEISRLRTHRKLVLVLTDGEPSDIDVSPDDLIADARHAIVGLKARGIDVFGVTLGTHDMASADAVFGRGRHMTVRRVTDLPARLSDLYFRLARR